MHVRDIMATKVFTIGADKKLFVAPPGRLAAYSLDGAILWERQ